MDAYLDKIKKFWQDKRGKAAIKLFLYILIVAFALFSVKTSNRNKSNEIVVNKKPSVNLTATEVLDNFKTLDNYKAVYKIDEEEYIYTNVSYDGTVNDILVIGEDKFFVRNGKLVNTLDSSLEVPKYDFEFWYLTPSFISILRETGVEEYTKKFTTGKTEFAYLVSLSDFISSFEGVRVDTSDSKELEGKNIEVLISVMDNQVLGVSLDLSMFFKLLDEESHLSRVTISYDYAEK